VQLSGNIIASLGHELIIDLDAQTVDAHHFDIAKGDKYMLINGLDPIALTLENESDITAYFAKDSTLRPWLY